MKQTPFERIYPERAKERTEKNEKKLEASKEEMKLIRRVFSTEDGVAVLAIMHRLSSYDVSELKLTPEIEFSHDVMVYSEALRNFYRYFRADLEPKTLLQVEELIVKRKHTP